MKKIIDNVVGFPNDAESIRFTACFVSMLMRAQGIIDEEQDFYCSSQNGPCIKCGKCENVVPLKRLHNEIYNLYTIVTGYGFLQIDLSNDEHMTNNWDFTSQVLLNEFDDYIDFTMDFAGYEYEKIQRPESKSSIYEKIKASIDRDVPVLIQFKHLLQWVLVTGYDDKNKSILGFDGSQGYWGASCAEPEDYEDNLFVMSDWYEKLACAYIVGVKKESKVGIRDVFKRGKQIMQVMNDEKYYQKSVAYIRNKSNFEDLNDEELLELRNRISRWIGQPIDIRAMMGLAMNPLKNDESFSRDEAITFHKINGLCWTIHDVLWIAWFAIGEYKGGEKLEWARGLLNPVIRNTVADCMDFVVRHDEMILDAIIENF